MIPYLRSDGWDHSDILQFQTPRRDLQSSRGISDLNDEHECDTEVEFKFGTFSLGDVIDGEIKKFGQFALRGKKFFGKAARKFLEEFTRDESM